MKILSMECKAQHDLVPVFPPRLPLHNLFTLFQLSGLPLFFTNTRSSFLLQNLKIVFLSADVTLDREVVYSSLILSKNLWQLLYNSFSRISLATWAVQSVSLCHGLFMLHCWETLLGGRGERQIQVDHKCLWRISMQKRGSKLAPSTQNIFWAVSS